LVAAILSAMKQISRLLLAAALLAGSPAAAQTPPYVHGATVGTSPIQALATNATRRKIFFYNPNATATIAFCPVGPNRDTGAALTCAVNGAGSITLAPGQGLVLNGSTDVQILSMPTAWNVVASTGGSTYTALDFE
jgi:hypothetical protein